MVLDGDYGIAVRTGPHCAPPGTPRPGQRRFRLPTHQPLGRYNADADMVAFLEAMKAILRHA